MFWIKCKRIFRALEISTSVMNSVILRWEGLEAPLSLEMDPQAAFLLLAPLLQTVRIRREILCNHQSLLVIQPKVLGGKGGFGRLLKTQKNLGKKTENFDSCRDLEGRRVRSVKREEKMDELEKNGSKSTSSKEEVASAPAKPHISLDEGYTKKLAEIRVEKEKSVLEGIKAANAAPTQPEQPPAKKMKTIALFDDEDSSDSYVCLDAVRKLMFVRLMRALYTAFLAVAIGTYPKDVDHSVVFPDEGISKRSVTGFISISASSDTFYWLFRSNEASERKPVLVWMQGQIGVSSLFGVLNEFTAKWLEDFNVLFIDAPVGTGFSRTSRAAELAVNSEQIASQTYHFLILFFERHSADVGSQVIIAGEDYAGHTIPVLAALIVHQQTRGERKFDLIGTAVGNGHTHAPIQVITKAESAAMFGLVDGSCLGEARQHAWLASVFSVAGETSASLNQRNLLEQTILNCASGIDMSNIGKLTAETQPDALMNRVQDFMNNKTLLGAIGVPADGVYVAKNVTVFNSLKPDIMRVIWQYIPPVLAANVPMLWYQGQLDWVDGVYSNEAWLNALEWRGSKAYAAAPRETWAGGFKRSSGPLTEAMVLGTGHLAIREKPDAIHSLFLETFIRTDSNRKIVVM